MHRTLLALSLAMLVLAGTLVSAGTTALADPPSEGERPEVADYAQTRLLKQAQGLIAEGQYAYAAGILGRVLEKGDDLVFRSRGEGDSFRSLRAAAESILLTLPAKGRKAYEEQFGIAARQMLNDAVEQRDFAALEELTRRYLFTRAGVQAGLLLTRRYLNRGEPLTASLFARRVLRNKQLDAGTRRELRFLLALGEWMSGRSDQADRELRTWRLEQAGQPFRLGGRVVPLFADNERPTRWLARVIGELNQRRHSSIVWSGELAGEGSPRGPLPWTDGETLTIFDESTLEDLGELESQREKRRLGRIPTTRPLFVGKVMLARTAQGLVAFNVESGQLEWRVDAEANPWGFERRVWDDVSWGALSSNGELVFSVEDWQFEAGMSYRGVMRRLDGEDPKLASRPPNFLSAYDIESGKLRWQVGTVFGDAKGSLGDARFLSCPLPLGDQLYAPIDYPEGARLVRLNAKGEVKEQWLLDSVESAPNTSRRSTVKEAAPPLDRIAPPVYSDGVLICATPRRRFVALDLVSGAVLWSWTEEDFDGKLSQAARLARLSQSRQSRGAATDRWNATSAEIYDDRVVLVSFESDQLVCLGLRSGEVIWKTPRRDGLYVAGEQNGQLIVVGRSSLQSIQLEDGAAAWDSRSHQYPGGSVPVGRGYFGDGQYYLPLTRGEVGVFDLATGRMATKVFSRDAAALGNLSSYGSFVFSTGISNIQRLRALSDFTSQSSDATASRDESPAAKFQLVAQRIASSQFEDALQILTADMRQDGEKTQQGEEIDRGRLQTLFVETLTLAMRQDPFRYRPYLETATELAAQGVDPVPAVCLAEQLVESNASDWAERIFQSLHDSAAPLQSIVPATANRATRLDRRIAAGLRRLGAWEPPPPAAEDPSFELPKVDPVLTELLADASIEVQAKEFPRGKYNPKGGQYLTVIVEEPAGSVSDLVVTYEYQKRVLLAQDRWGRSVFELELPAAVRRGGVSVYPTNHFQHAALADGVLVFHRGDLIIAVDLKSQPPSLAWTKPVWPDVPGISNDYLVLRRQLSALGLAFPNQRGATPLCDRVFPRYVAATGDGVCFQRGRELVCVDPNSGEPFWSRDDIPVGVDLMGGSEFVVVTPLAGDSSLVMDSLDGRIIVERPSLPIGKRLAFDSGRAVLFDTEDQPRKLGLYDFEQGGYAWQRDVAKGAVPVVGVNRKIGVLDVAGKFELLDFATGHVSLEVPLEPFERLTAATMLDYGDTIVLAADEFLETDNLQLGRRNPYAGEINLTGRLVGVSMEKGELRWSCDIENQRLRTTQPTGLPIVVASHLHQQAQKRNNRTTYGPRQARFDCIDVRTGKSLRSTSRDNVSGYSPFYRLQWNGTANQAVFDLRTDSVTLKFTAK